MTISARIGFLIVAACIAATRTSGEVPQLPRDYSNVTTCLCLHVPGGDPEERDGASCEQRLSDVEEQLEWQRKARVADQEQISQKLRENFDLRQKGLLDENRDLKLRHGDEEKKRVELQYQLKEARKGQGPTCDHVLNDWREKVKLANENCQHALAEKERQYREDLQKLNIELEVVREAYSEDEGGLARDRRISELMSVIDELKGKLQSSEEDQQKVMSVQGDVEQLRQQVVSERERAENAESSLKQSQEEAETLHQQAISTKNRSQEAEKKLDTLQQHLTAEQRKVSDLSKQLESKTSELNEVKENDSQSDEEAESLKQQLETVQEERDTLEDEAELLKSRAEVRASEIDEMKSRLETSATDAAKLKEERDRLAEETSQMSLKFGVAVGVVAILLVHEVFLFCRTGMMCVNVLLRY